MFMLFWICKRKIQERWGPEYKDKLFSGGMNFSDEGNVIENKLLSAILDQGGFLAAFTGERWTRQHSVCSCFMAKIMRQFHATIPRIFLEGSSGCISTTGKKCRVGVFAVSNEYLASFIALRNITDRQIIFLTAL